MGKLNEIYVCLAAAEDIDELSMETILDTGDGFQPFELEPDELQEEEEFDDSPFSKEKENKVPAEEDLDPNNIFGSKKSPEKVSGKEKDTSEETKEDKNQGQEQEDTESKEEDDSTSPNPKFYSSILTSLKKDSVLPDIDDEFIEKAESPEDFAAAIEKQVEARLDETQKKLKEYMEIGVEPDEVQQYEDTINYLDSVTEEALEDEGEEGEELRKNLIYQDYINRGFKPERAQKEVNKSVSAGSDIEDAKSALESNKEFYNSAYKEIISERRAQAQQAAAERKQYVESFKKRTLDTEEPFPGIKLDKNTRQRIFESVTKPVYKDEQGRVYTAIQKYSSDNPIEAQYHLALLYTMTDGFKSIDRLIGKRAKSTAKENIRTLEKTLSSTGNQFKDSGNDIFSREENSLSGDIVLDI